MSIILHSNVPRSFWTCQFPCLIETTKNNYFKSSFPVNIGFDDGLMLIRQQSIVETSIDTTLRCKYAPPGLQELIRWRQIPGLSIGLEPDDQQYAAGIFVPVEIPVLGSRLHQSNTFHYSCFSYIVFLCHWYRTGTEIDSIHIHVEIGGCPCPFP